jgi:hypothetical protein
MKIDATCLRFCFKRRELPIQLINRLRQPNRRTSQPLHLKAEAIQHLRRNGPFPAHLAHPRLLCVFTHKPRSARSRAAIARDLRPLRRRCKHCHTVDCSNPLRRDHAYKLSPLRSSSIFTCRGSSSGVASFITFEIMPPKIVSMSEPVNKIMYPQRRFFQIALNSSGGMGVFKGCWSKFTATGQTLR